MGTSPVVRPFAATTNTESQAVTVVMVGPPAEAVGGMATVATQILQLDFDGRYRVQYLAQTSAPDGREGRLRKLIRHWQHLRGFRSLIRRHAASVVHLHTCSRVSFFRSTLDMVTAQRLGGRVILHIHGAAFDEFYAASNAFVRRVISWSLSRADAVVALSHTWKGKLLAMAPGANVTVIENAVALPQRDARRARQSDDMCRLLLLARMDVWKGVDDLLAACAILRSSDLRFELTLAGPPGTAGDRERLARKIIARRLDGIVRYVGPVHGKAKQKLLGGSDVYVQPSHNEGMPIALLEALAQGLPVVATSVGAVPEVIVDGSEGLLIPPRSPEALAHALRLLIDDPARRARMSVAARRLVERRFTLERLAGELIAVYHELSASELKLLHRTGERESVAAPYPHFA